MISDRIESTRVKIFASLALISGFLVAWVLAPLVSEASGDSPEEPPSGDSIMHASRSEARRATLRTEESGNIYDDLSEKLGRAYKEEDFAVLLDAEGNDVIVGLLAYYQTKVGFSGLSHPNKRTYEKVIGYWFDQNPKAALTWCSELEHEKDRIKILGKILQELAKEDFTLSHEYVRQYMQLDDGSVSLPYGFLQLAAEHSPETLVQASKETTAALDGWSKEYLRYPPDFPFFEVVNELYNHEKALSEDEYMAVSPANLLEEWTKVAPQEAYDWVLSDDSSERTSNIRDFFKGYSVAADPDDIGRLLAGLVTVNNPRTIVKEVLDKKPDTRIYSSFLNNLDEGVDREAVEKQVLKSVMTNGKSEAVDILLATIPMEDHFTTFADNNRLFRCITDYNRATIINALVKAGHLREVIETRFPEAE